MLLYIYNPTTINGQMIALQVNRMQDCNQRLLLAAEEKLKDNIIKGKKEMWHFSPEAKSLSFFNILPS